MIADAVTRSPRILQLLLSPRVGGAESLVAALNDVWVAEGIWVKTIYLDDSGDRESRAERWRRLRRYERIYRPDVVLAHSTIPAAYARIAFSRFVPVIPVLHSASDDFATPVPRIRERILRLNTARVVGVSKAQVDQYAAHFTTRIPVSTIPNGLRPGISQRNSYRSVPLLAVTAARVAAQKRPDLWVATAQMAAHKMPSMLFEWAGPIADSCGISATEQAAELSNARMVGPLDDPSSLLARGDFYLHTSRREAFSIGLIEAAAAGLPIVCSADVAATLPVEAVSVTFTEGKAPAVNAAIETLTGSRWPLYAERAVQASNLIATKYSREVCAASYLDVVMQSLNSRGVKTADKERML